VREKFNGCNNSLYMNVCSGTKLTELKVCFEQEADIHYCSAANGDFANVVACKNSGQCYLTTTI